MWISNHLVQIQLRLFRSFGIRIISVSTQNPSLNVCFFPSLGIRIQVQDDLIGFGSTDNIKNWFTSTGLFRFRPTELISRLSSPFLSTKEHHKVHCKNDEDSGNLINFRFTKEKAPDGRSRRFHGIERFREKQSIIRSVCVQSKEDY